MTEPANGVSAAGVALGHYAHVLRTRWTWVGVGTAFGLLAALVFLLIVETRVSATATVQIDAVATNPFGLDRAASSLIDPSTERRIAGSYAVAEAASAILGGEPGPEEVQAALGISTEPDGTIVLIAFTGASAAEARRGADAVAQAYLDFRGGQVEERVASLAEVIDARVQELVVLQGEILAGLPGEPEDGDPRSAAEAELARASQEMESLLGQRTTLLGISTAGGQILNPAENAPVTVGPSRSMVLAAGVLAGLILGSVLAFVRHRTARMLSTGADVEQITGAQVWDPYVTASGESSWRGAGELLLGTMRGRPPRVAVLSLVDTSSAEAVLADLCAARHDDEEADLTWDLVEVDAPLAERLRAARRAGDVVLIVDPGTTRRADLMGLVDALRQMGCVIVGTVTAPRTAGTAESPPPSPSADDESEREPSSS